LITAYFDGGARSNPGPAGYGVYIVDDAGNVLAELSGSLGNTTNNIAEYNGLIAALQWAVDHDLKSIAIKGDSLLIIDDVDTIPGRTGIASGPAVEICGDQKVPGCLSA